VIAVVHDQVTVSTVFERKAVKTAAQDFPQTLFTSLKRGVNEKRSEMLMRNIEFEKGSSFVATQQDI
jgi:hypothetical protein